MRRHLRPKLYDPENQDCAAVWDARRWFLDELPHAAPHVLSTLHDQVLPFYKAAPCLRHRWTATELRLVVGDEAAAGWLLPSFTLVTRAIRNGATELRPLKRALLSVTDRLHLRTPWFLDWAVNALGEWHRQDPWGETELQDLLPGIGPSLVEGGWLRIPETRPTKPFEQHLDWLISFQLLEMSFKEIADAYVKESRGRSASAKRIEKVVENLARFIGLPLRRPDWPRCQEPLDEARFAVAWPAEGEASS